MNTSQNIHKNLDQIGLTVVSDHYKTIPIFSLLLDIQ